MIASRDFAFYRSEIASAGSVSKAMNVWLDRIEAAHEMDSAVWISRFCREYLLEEAARLDVEGSQGRALFGLPFAVKDNIDVCGLPTTAACPAYSYEPSEDATVVALLRQAGAICIGKTNLDQFATGLVGTRSPYGIPRNAWREDLIPGGSSSGSAVAVASGLVAFSLGTDTAGSGRVPAALNGIVGWKPTRGIVSTRGVVPACRSLDCVSLFVSSAGDLSDLQHVVQSFDKADAWARKVPAATRSLEDSIVRVAIPLEEEMEFFGDRMQVQAWWKAVAELERRGVQIRQTKCGAFFEAARLLYEGPWVAERFNVVGELLGSDPDAVHAVTKTIISGGSKPTACGAFAAMDRLAQLRRESEEVWEWAHALCLPTIGTIFTVEQVLADPLTLNTNLGFYTNFLNLLDLSGIAVPAGQREDGLPFGITLIAPAFQDARLIGFASGATESPCSGAIETTELAVFGAHMRGLPLCPQLRDLGAEFVREDRTASEYRMFALDALRPGVIRCENAGAQIALEIWKIPAISLGALLARIPSPLGLGKITLADGSEVCGFLCEQYATVGRLEITQAGGWRNHLEFASSQP